MPQDKDVAAIPSIPRRAGASATCRRRRLPAYAETAGGALKALVLAAYGLAPHAEFFGMAEIVFKEPIAPGKYNLVVYTRGGNGPDYKVRHIGHPVTVIE